MKNLRILLCFFMAFAILSCSDNKTTPKPKPKPKPNPTPKPSPNSDNNLGYKNSTFKYTYYPKDKKIYYASKNKIHTMNLDGTGKKLFNENTADENTIENIAVYKDWVYFAVKGGKIYRSSISNPSNIEAFANGYGNLKIYKDRLYFFHDNKLYSRDYNTPSQESSPSKEILTDPCGEYWYDIKDDEIYYSCFDALKKKNLKNNTVTELSSRLYDNYLIVKDKIYFRAHPKEYSVGYNTFYMKPEYAITLKTSKEIADADGSLNVSDDWIVYVNRGDRSDMNFLSADGKTERILIEDLSKSPILKNDVKIIGDWAYYMSKDDPDNPTKYNIFRINKSGENASKKLVEIEL